MRAFIICLILLSVPALAQQPSPHTPAISAAASRQEGRISVDTHIHLTLTLGVPLAEFKQQHPEAICSQNNAASFCKLPHLSKEFCTMIDCLGGTILFARGKTCGLIVEATSYEWVFVRNLMNKAHPVREEVQEMPAETVYVSHWNGKQGSLFFTQDVSKSQAHPPGYKIGFIGASPHSCYNR